jgi:hypothetical protein
MWQHQPWDTMNIQSPIKYFTFLMLPLDHHTRGWPENGWFLGYSMTMFQLHRLYSIKWNGKITINDEYGFYSRQLWFIWGIPAFKWKDMITITRNLPEEPETWPKPRSSWVHPTLLLYQPSQWNIADHRQDWRRYHSVIFFQRQKNRRKQSDWKAPAEIY